MDLSGNPTSDLRRQYSGSTASDAASKRLYATHGQVHDVIHSAPTPLGTHGVQVNSPMASFDDRLRAGRCVATWLKDSSQNNYLLVTNRSTQNVQTVKLPFELALHWLSTVQSKPLARGRASF